MLRKLKSLRSNWLLIVIVLAVLCPLGYSTYASDIKERCQINEPHSSVLEIAKKLPNSGVLKMKPNGYFYLKISDAYINEIHPLIIPKGKYKPLDYKIGAHISVKSEKEGGLIMKQELGESFSFEPWYFNRLTVDELSSAEQEKLRPKGIKALWILVVRASQLVKLRERCGLTPIWSNHPFHISIGYETN